MKANGSSTGEIYSSYKNLCKTVGKDELHKEELQMLSEIELSGIISGRLVHQGIHGRTKKYKLNSFFRNNKKDIQRRSNFAGYYLIRIIILMENLKGFQD